MPQVQLPKRNAKRARTKAEKRFRVVMRFGSRRTVCAKCKRPTSAVPCPRCDCDQLTERVNLRILRVRLARGLWETIRLPSDLDSSLLLATVSASYRAVGSAFVTVLLSLPDSGKRNRSGSRLTEQERRFSGLLSAFTHACSVRGLACVRLNQERYDSRGEQTGTVLHAGLAAFSVRAKRSGIDLESTMRELMGLFPAIREVSEVFAAAGGNSSAHRMRDGVARGRNDYDCWMKDGMEFRQLRLVAGAKEASSSGASKRAGCVGNADDGASLRAIRDLLERNGEGARIRPPQTDYMASRTIPVDGGQSPSYSAFPSYAAYLSAYCRRTHHVNAPLTKCAVCGH